MADPKAPQPAPKAAPAAAPAPLANKKLIIDALLLACASSGLKEIVGLDALRMVVEPRYIDMVKTPGKFDLRPFWQLLESQPGFTSEIGAPAMCRFKSWESQLGVIIDLPPSLAALSKIQRDSLATKCKPSDKEMFKIFSPAEAQAQKEAARAAVQEQYQAPQVADEKRERKLKGLAVVLGMIGVLCVGGVTLFVLKEGDHAKTVKPADLGTDIPVASARLTGDVVGATLKDAAWLQKPAEEKKKQSLEALLRLDALGVKSLIILDPTGKVKVMAYVTPDGQRLVTMK